MGKLIDLYRDTASKTVTALNEVSKNTGLTELPEKIVILPHYMLPNGVVAAVGETYNSTKTLFLNAKETYTLNYDDFKGVLTHELAHLWEMSGKKLSKLLTPENAYQEALLDTPVPTTSEVEGRVNAVATKLAEKAGYGTKILDGAYTEATNYFSGLMNAAKSMPDVAENAYRSITGCKNCSGC